MKKRAFRITAVFFSVMLILTFLSRTIYRSTLPKVDFKKPIGGTLKYSIEEKEFAFVADHYLYEFIPFILPYPITIAEVYGNPGEKIVEGSPLIAFYAPDGKYLLEKAETELIAARDASEAWDIAMSDAIIQLSKKIEDAKTSDETDALSKQLNFLISGILDESSAQIIYERLRIAEDLVSYLRDLEKNSWILKAQVSGTLCRIIAEIDSSYSGIKPLCYIADEESSVYISTQISSGPDMHYGEWNMTAYLDTSGGLVEAKIRSSNERRIQTYIPESIEMLEISSIIVKLESPYEDLLIPITAVYDGNVYLLEHSVGAWGQTKYIASKRKVFIKNMDYDNVALFAGIGHDDKVIISSTEEINDKQIVVLNNFEHQ